MNRKILLPVLMLLLVGGFITAIDWPFNKTQTCDAFNITGITCETFWCNSIQNGTYDVSKELCTIVINETIIVNQTINETNITGAYNLSEIEKLIDNKTATLRDSISDNYALKTEVSILGGTSSDSDSGINTSTIIVVGLVAVVLIFLFLQAKKGGIQTPVQQGQAPIERRPLQTKKEMERDEAIQDALEEIRKLKKQIAKEESE